MSILNESNKNETKKGAALLSQQRCTTTLDLGVFMTIPIV